MLHAYQKGIGPYGKRLLRSRATDRCCVQPLCHLVMQAVKPTARIHKVRANVQAVEKLKKAPARLHALVLSKHQKPAQSFAPTREACTKEVVEWVLMVRSWVQIPHGTDAVNKTCRASCIVWQALATTRACRTHVEV